MSEISLTCVINIIDVCQKYYLCVMEIPIDVCFKYYTVQKYVNAMDIFWPRNFRLSSDRHILTMRCILVTYKRTGKFLDVGCDRNVNMCDANISGR